jgi:hypothetical protein
MPNVNHNFRGRRGWRAAASDLGWADYRAGLPYHPQYDGWDSVAQRNYENGRLRAANVALAFTRIPRRQPADGDRDNAIKRAVRAVGPSIPPRRVDR